MTGPPETGGRAAAWSDLDAEIVAPGVLRQVFHGERQSIVRYRYERGAVFPTHAHPEEQITIVVSGRLAFDIAGERIEVGPGEVLLVPADRPHGATVVGDEVVETYNALSPRRDVQPGPTTG